ncbi:MAG: nucleotidyl transferase AbiEii/AbiGii toxin family protein [Kiritimatiellae bacterium]|nr:nucleotidyl transferase AbiEii/AbiGii toxin family protein [Kiritimatiellia bacterium]
MTWENSKAITPLKRDFLKAFFSREKRFFLTGGSALGLFYLQHRYSYDLDLFSVEHLDWLELDGVMRLCARDSNADLELLRDAPTFRRYHLTTADHTEIIDIVFDVSPQIDQEKRLFGDVRVDTLHEIMLNKITTLISRCELKDIVDLYFLEQEGFQIEACFEDAQQKDGGLDPGMISLLLNSVAIVELPDYLIKPLTLEALRTYVDDLKRRMVLMAYPDETRDTP